LDPHIPKVGNFVLSYPTPKEVRRQKADNFAFMQSSQAAPSTPSARAMTDLSPLPTDLEEYRSTSFPQVSSGSNNHVLLPNATYSHQRCRLAMPGYPEAALGEEEEQTRSVRTSIVNSVTTAADSQQEFVEFNESMLDTSGFDPSWVLSFEMVNGGTDTAQADSGLRGGEATIISLVPVGHRQDIEGESGPRTVPPSDPPNQLTAVTSCSPIPEHPSDHESQDLHGRGTEDNDALSDKEFGGHCTSGIESCLVQANLRDSHQSNGPNVTPADTPEPQRRRTANRHARLIDGTIFSFRGRKSSVARPSVDLSRAATPEAARRSLFRLSWTPTRQSSDSRRSWLQGFRSLFRSNHNNPSKAPSKRRRSCSTESHIDAGSGMLRSHERMSSDAHRHPPRPRFDLDGACDDVVSPSSSYLNKPLPLNPEEIVKSISSRTHSLETRPSPIESYQQTSASTISTGISQTSSKRDFRSVARELVSSNNFNSDMHLSNYPQLSPVRESRLDPAKFDPEKSPVPPISWVQIPETRSFDTHY
jgi:hypothetical protein